MITDAVGENAGWCDRPQVSGRIGRGGAELVSKFLVTDLAEDKRLKEKNCPFGWMSTPEIKMGPFAIGFQLFRYFWMSSSVGTQSHACVGGVVTDGSRNKADSRMKNVRRGPTVL